MGDHAVFDQGAFPSRSVPRDHDIAFDDLADGSRVEQNTAYDRIQMEAAFALDQAARDRELPDVQKRLEEPLHEQMVAGTAPSS
ncbi:hypothetical protein [Tardiphaga sp. 813_E8_N1_3]|uniref:hypothetical protein n=1 Tax=Tardiphaga sp. 813_E8_N1_3 TaxID=3240760 RepID=UPI003F25D290